jgi:micrococcal nuclease
MLRKLLLCFALILSACGAEIDLSIQAPATFSREPGGYETATVTRVVDGDTLVVDITARSDGPGAGLAPIGGDQRVRLIGIDTPESVDPRRPVGCFGKESSAATAALVEGAEVRLVKDVEESDSFDRLLRYVYLGDEMVNARLVVNGYATAFTYPPNVRWSELFVQLEREAREGARGLWSMESCNGKP